MSNSGYGPPTAPPYNGGNIPGQRLPTQPAYEAPACVQNAMMTKDKKPFTYTPGGIDLSQIKSERMAKRLARNAQAEGAGTGAAQLHRPNQPQSPGTGAHLGTAAAAMGASALGLPFQVFPTGPPPPPQPAAHAIGKSNGSNGIVPPPPPPSSTLAPPTGKGSAPGSPSMARKSPTPQRFEPPPLGFRPEIKIPTNPMASLKKVPPPVEKGSGDFWVEEYRKERSKSPMVNSRDPSPRPGSDDANVSDNVRATENGSTGNEDHKKSVNSSPKIDTTVSNNSPNSSINHNNLKASVSNNSNDNSNDTNSYKPYSPQTSAIQQQPQQQENQQKQTTSASPQAEFKSVSTPQATTASIYTKQSQLQQQEQQRARSPFQADATNQHSPQQQRATDSPFRFAQQQQQQQQSSAPIRSQHTISPLAQQQWPPTTAPQTTSAVTTNNVPWRTQKAQQPDTTYQGQQRPISPQPQHNNVTKARDVFSPSVETQKPTNVGSLYIAPLPQSAEPQAQEYLRQTQQPVRASSPMRQVPQQQQQQKSQVANQQRQPPVARWMTTQPAPKEEVPWARPEENGNVLPSSLQRLKSPPPPSSQMQNLTLQQQQQNQAQSQYQQTQNQYQQPQSSQYQQPQAQYQQPKYQYQQPQPQYQHPQYQYQQPQSQYHQPQNQYQQTQTQYQQGNGYGPATNSSTHYLPGHHGTPVGLRLHITTGSNSSSQSGGHREHIIPIQLESTPTPTRTPGEPSFGQSNVSPSSYVVRSPNQFVDQGYNNFPTTTQQQQPPQRVLSPTQQLNSPRLIQQQNVAGNSNVVGGGAGRTRIVPIALENSNEGTRGPVAQSPIVIQNDQRTTPVQSKSFRILQKITDTIDDATNVRGEKSAANTPQADSADPQLQRPQFARQMSSQQARNSPTIEQMRRMQNAQEQQQWSQGKSINTSTKEATTRYEEQNSINHKEDISSSYIHPSEQQVLEPKIYTGSAIPSRSFKILQAMTTPENAGPGQSDL